MFLYVCVSIFSVFLCFNVGQVLESCRPTFLSNCNVICFVSFICTFSTNNRYNTNTVGQSKEIHELSCLYTETDILPSQNGGMYLVLVVYTFQICLQNIRT